jgi:hypothetical protein
MGINCVTSSISTNSGMAAVGVNLFATLINGCSFGVNSLSTAGTFNVSVPQSVRYDGGTNDPTGSDAHLLFGSSLTSYSTQSLTTNDVITFPIINCAFTPNRICFMNVGSGSGSLSIAIGVTGDTIRYLTTTSFTLGAARYGYVILPMTNIIAAISDLVVTITSFTVTTAPFTPRVTVLGMLYQMV